MIKRARQLYFRLTLLIHLFDFFIVIQRKPSPFAKAM